MRLGILAIWNKRRCHSYPVTIVGEQGGHYVVRLEEAVGPHAANAVVRAPRHAVTVMPGLL